MNRLGRAGFVGAHYMRRRVVPGLAVFGALAALVGGSAASGSSGPGQAARLGIKPYWKQAGVDVKAGARLTATLAPTTATQCVLVARGPYEGQAEQWTLHTAGHPLDLSMPTKSSA